MVRFDNPFDISKDGQNPFIDGIRIHIRASADNKERIIEYIKICNGKVTDFRCWTYCKWRAWYIRLD